MRLVDVVGTWGKPPEIVARGACVVAVVLLGAALFGGGRRWLGFEEDDTLSRRAFLTTTAFAAALLSLGYVALYLHGGPRIVDATTYFLQGRAISRGDFSWVVEAPASASYRGRFLYYSEAEREIGGIFPPGYPLLLAFGFALGAPMVIGPLLAALLVVVTYALAKELARRAELSFVEPIARGAALLSVACAALRYHTADTMSHALTALGIAAALTFALRAQRTQTRANVFLAGLAISVVVVTRPVSALPITIVVSWLLRDRLRDAALATVPGLLLLVLFERAVTGRWFVSAQSAYYAVADGPPGCFRWGFGRGTGCLNEHGEFVRARLPHGYGAIEAAGTTLRRLKMHVLDIANFEPLALLVLAPLKGACARARPALALVGLQILAYAPFYFDGNYPGGGARFFADVLPVEHALIAVAIATLAGSGGFLRTWLVLLAASLAGFGVHAAFDHGKLRDREGGKPMFEPDVLAKANVNAGLVFVETDHGFSLGYDAHANPHKSVHVARKRRDDRDRLLYETLGKPPVYSYDYDIGSGNAVISPWVPPELGARLRFEAEAEWPPLAQEGGFAAPAPATCASGGRALVLTPSSSIARATIALPVPSAGTWSVVVRVAHGARVPSADAPEGNGVVTIGRAVWRVAASAGLSCDELAEQTVELPEGEIPVRIEARDGAFAVDQITLKKAE